MQNEEYYNSDNTQKNFKKTGKEAHQNLFVCTR